MSDTKDYIIEEAYKLFLSKSYEAVSINEISNAVGLTKGALYHHFKNKEDIFKAVIDKHLKIFGLDKIKETTSLEKYIQRTIENSKKLVQRIVMKEHLFVPTNYLTMYIDAFRHYPSFADKKENIFSSEINQIKFVFDNAVKSGEIRKDINTSIMALNYFSILVGISANLFRSNSPEAAVKTLHSQLNEIYNLLKL